jgi:hypothetical protein
MQSVDQEANEEENLERVGDEAKPFSPPDDIKDTLTKSNQAFDTGVDADEWYQKGDKATGVEDPGNRGVKGYNPPPRPDQPPHIPEDQNQLR